MFSPLPEVGAWRLTGAHEGFEVTRFAALDGRIVLTGTTVGIEDGVPWSLRYVIELDHAWRTRTAVVTDVAGRRLDIDADGAGRWKIDGTHDPRLDGCLDLDLEASVVTNTAPVHRLALAVGAQGSSAAAYVRTTTLALERLDQTYRRLPDEGGAIVFDYAAPRFGYHDHLRFDADGLVVDYPQIGSRVRVHRGPDPS